jgi:hypothetical protein
VIVAVASPITDAVIDAVHAISNPAGGVIQVGDAIRPAAPERPPRGFYPYAVVYAGIVRTEGTLVDPHEDGVHRVQVTCVGLDRAGAEWLRDEVRQILLDKTALDVDGHVVVWTESAGEPSVFRDEDVKPALFVAPIVVNIKVTPTSGS